MFFATNSKITMARIEEFLGIFQEINSVLYFFSDYGFNN